MTSTPPPSCCPMRDNPSSRYYSDSSPCVGHTIDPERYRDNAAGVYASSTIAYTGTPARPSERIWPTVPWYTGYRPMRSSSTGNDGSSATPLVAVEAFVGARAPAAVAAEGV